jgi:hypothetical protein
VGDVTAENLVRLAELETLEQRGTLTVKECPQCGESPDSPTWYRHSRCRNLAPPTGAAWLELERLRRLRRWQTVPAR